MHNKCALLLLLLLGERTAILLNLFASGENSNTAECVCVFSFGRNISTFYILLKSPLTVEPF